MFQMCYCHQHACLLVFLSVSQTSIDDSGQGKYRATLQFKSSGCAVSNNFMTQVSVCQSLSKLSQNHLTHVLIQPSVVASN